MRPSLLSFGSIGARLAGAALILAGGFAPVVQARIVSLEPLQTIPSSGPFDFEPFTIDGAQYAAIASHRDDVGFGATSTIYRWSGAEFLEYQSFPTLGAYDWEFMTVDGTPFLAVTQFTDGTTRTLDSKVFRWDGSQFVPFLFEIESVVSATPDPAAVVTCHAGYSLDGVLSVPRVDVPVVTAIGGFTVTTGVDSFGGTLELLPMGDLFTLTELHSLP